MERISVLLADDHPVVRQGLRTLLELQDDIELVGRRPTAPRRSPAPRSCCPTSC
jgi:DNA-binding NarL/FixJ family response regulator